MNGSDTAGRSGGSIPPFAGVTISPQDGGYIIEQECPSQGRQGIWVPSAYALDFHAIVERVMTASTVGRRE